MNLAIVAYPTLDDGDRQRLESFRAEHEPRPPESPSISRSYPPSKDHQTDSRRS